MVRKLNSFYGLIKSLKSFRYFFKRADILLFDGGRQVNIDGGKYNPTTLAFIRSLSEKYTVTIVDMNGLVEKSYYPGVEVIDISKFLSIFRILSRLVSKKKWNRYINKIQSKIFKDYDKVVNLDSIFSNVYTHQFIVAFFTKLLHKVKKYKVMIYSDNASHSMSINYARKNNIITIDYQHSIVSKLNILYSHPSTLTQAGRSYLSEYIFSYGSFWLKYFNQYYKVYPVGSFQQELVLNQSKDIEKDRGCITIVSGILSRKILVEVALFISKANPSLKIFYKLRPEEYDNWSDKYPEEIKLNKKISFIDNNTQELHYYLKKSEYVIGINSTVLIEALPFSKVIIYNHGWSDEMKDIIEAGYALEANDFNEVVRIIKNNEEPLKNSISEDFFKSNVQSNICSVVSQLI